MYTGNGERQVVLVTDDEPIVLKVIRVALAREGYEVLTASSGEEALEVSRSYSGPIHMLLTDFKMPGIDGVRLAELMSLERPGIRIAVMSGKAPTGLPESYRGLLVRKPFTVGTLRAKVREALASGTDYAFLSLYATANGHTGVESTR